MTEFDGKKTMESESIFHHNFGHNAWQALGGKPIDLLNEYFFHSTGKLSLQRLARFAILLVQHLLFIPYSC